MDEKSPKKEKKKKKAKKGTETTDEERFGCYMRHCLVPHFGESEIGRSHSCGFIKERRRLVGKKRMQEDETPSSCQGFEDDWP